MRHVYVEEVDLSGRVFRGRFARIFGEEPDFVLLLCLWWPGTRRFSLHTGREDSSVTRFRIARRSLSSLRSRISRRAQLPLPLGEDPDV